MEDEAGLSNVYTLRELSRIPADNRIRRLLDPAPPEHFDETFISFAARLDQSGALLYGLGELDALASTCAATVHKSQDSELPAAVIPMLSQHYAMLKRNLIYTGVTRGKRLLVLIRKKKAVAIAVRNASGCRRWSRLDEWLVGAMDGAEAAAAGCASCL